MSGAADDTVQTAISSSSLIQSSGATEHAQPPLKQEFYGARILRKHPPPVQPDDTSSPTQQRGVAEHSDQAPQPPTAAPTPSTTSSLTLQCPACKRVLCQICDLAFFHRCNPQGGLEVHLMLKPEIKVPDTFVPAASLEKGALHSWSCACGAKLGDTRPIAVRHAPMTAFKSASVILCGHHFPGKKSKWPAVYNTPPFDCIEVRHRDTFSGPHQLG